MSGSYSQSELPASRYCRNILIYIERIEWWEMYAKLLTTTIKGCFTSGHNGKDHLFQYLGQKSRWVPVRSSGLGPHHESMAFRASRFHQEILILLCGFKIYSLLIWVHWCCLHTHQKRASHPITDGSNHHVAPGNSTQDLLNNSQCSYCCVISPIQRDADWQNKIRVRGFFSKGYIVTKNLNKFLKHVILSRLEWQCYINDLVEVIL